MSFEEWKNKNLAKGESKTWIEWCGEAYEASAASRQGEIDKLQKRIDDALMEMMNQLDHDYDDMDRPDYDAMRYALIGIKDILKGQNNG